MEVAEGSLRGVGVVSAHEVEVGVASEEGVEEVCVWITLYCRHCYNHHMQGSEVVGGDELTINNYHAINYILFVCHNTVWTLTSENHKIKITYIKINEIVCG